ncbi:hypothetical protein J0X08_05276 (plasmid) [Klebsiella variicola]|nr:hypothetical protein [Klebsiella variicola]
MDSEEPPNVRVACSGDIDEVVRLMHDAAAWMSAKGTPPGTSRGSTGHSRRLRPEIRAPSRSCSDGIVAVAPCRPRIRVLADALKGEAAYLHKLAVRRTHAGRGVSSALIEACRHAARTQGCAKLRLDCHRTCVAYTSGSDSPTSTLFNPGWDPTFIAERLELEI